MQRFLRSAAGLFLAALILRSPSFLFDIVNIDEVHFGLLGRSILNGGLPYVDAIDIKPPLTYLAFTAGGLFGGVSLLPVHLLGVPWLVATCLVLREAARRWTGSEDAGWAAAWIALLANLCEVPSVSAELLMNLPLALALLCAVRAEEDRPRFDLLCGICVGVASLFKHQAAMLGVGLGIALLWRGRNKALRATLLLGGFVLPWAATVAFYAAAGHLHEFNNWVFLRNLLYAEKSGAGPALGRFVHGTVLSLAIALLGWVLAVQETLRPSQSAREPIRTAVLISLWLTWVPVSLGGRFYEHYYLQFAPPLALAAAPRLGALLGRWREIPRLGRAAVWLACCLPAVGYLGYTVMRGVAGQFPAQDQKVVTVSRWLVDNSRPDQRIFVWGDATSVYYLAHRTPGTRYLNCAVEVGNYDPSHLPREFDVASHVSAPDVEATIADLERNRVGLVVDTSSAAIHDWDRLPLSRVTALASYVDAHYRLVASPGGVRVYARR